VVKQAEKFVPILVDADVEKELCTKFGVNGFPQTIFVDLKGRQVGEVGGYVEKSVFLGQIEAAVKKIGPVKLKKAAKDLEDAGKALAKAREKKDWRATLKSVAAIEKIDHEGKTLDAAREAKQEASAEARKRVDEGKDLLKVEKRDEARKVLQKVVSEFEGLEEAAEAKTLLKELDAKAPEDGKKGG